MICLLASNRMAALRFALSQDWDQKEFFSGTEETLRLMKGTEYTILRLPCFFELPFEYWSRIENMAREAKKK